MLKEYYNRSKYFVDFELKLKRPITQVICEDNFSIISECSYTTGNVYEVDGGFNYIINGGMFPIQGSFVCDNIETFMIYLDRLIEKLKYQHIVMGTGFFK